MRTHRFLSNGYRYTLPELFTVIVLIGHEPKLNPLTEYMVRIPYFSPLLFLAQLQQQLTLVLFSIYIITTILP